MAFATVVDKVICSFIIGLNFQVYPAAVFGAVISVYVDTIKRSFTVGRVFVIAVGECPVPEHFVTV